MKYFISPFGQIVGKLVWSAKSKKIQNNLAWFSFTHSICMIRQFISHNELNLKCFVSKKFQFEYLGAEAATNISYEHNYCGKLRWKNCCFTIAKFYSSDNES